MRSAAGLRRRSIFARYELSGTRTYTYTGAAQTFFVPPGVTTVTLDVVGAAGGDEFSPGNTIPKGARVQAVLDVTPGQVLQINVGGKGGDAEAGGGTGLPGWNGGGLTVGTGSGAGGGASDVRQGGTALTDRVVVAGGAGGNGGNLAGTGNSRGGDGGQVGADGEDGIGASRGLKGVGGSASAGGAGGLTTSGGGVDGAAGTLGVGGDGGGVTTRSGGGGGGGYYGGGGGGGATAGSSGGGGGGGSSYAAPGITSTVTYTVGFNDDDGYIVVSW